MTTQQTQTQRNFPAATEEQWNRAWGIVYRAARRAGYDPATAADMAQNAMLTIRGRRYRRTSPRTPEIAAARLVRGCRIRTWRDVMDLEHARRTRPEWSEHDRAAHMQTMATYRQRSGSLTPDEIVARAEEWGPATRAAAVRMAEADGLVDAVLASQGIGPTAAVHEHGHTPSIYGTGQHQRPPLRGCPGLHTACDPVPGSHARRAEECARHAAELRG